jgi:hypothetical protein
MKCLIQKKDMVGRRMMMTRTEFWEWMKTCPADWLGDDSGWTVSNDEGTDVRIFFHFKENDDE